MSGLRTVQRLTVGFLDPVEDAVYLTVGLRRMGFPASFHLGREVAPALPPAGFYAWVRCGGDVLSTSLPVEEEYVEIYTNTPEGEHSA
ncbi:lasso peptide biosynthesis protein [Streptomyces beigongshangae]|uniref:lasso peptide biosynthesis protein n=1 Tax=Streptomyces beigongshangae TaxID=2841597 RepID=UPI001C8429B9|nr:lasso peptide biosynthesis protein [Streptomyces sp. REN17]